MSKEREELNHALARFPGIVLCTDEQVEWPIDRLLWMVRHIADIETQLAAEKRVIDALAVALQVQHGVSYGDVIDIAEGARNSVLHSS